MNVTKSTTVIGAGLAGSLMAIVLARRGIAVRLLERRPDLRKQSLAAGRSINLALADRGIHALKQAGVFAMVEPLLTPMPGRCVHDLDSQTHFIPYGQRPHEIIYSVSRSGLNQALLDYLEQQPGVELQFEFDCVDIDIVQRRLQWRDGNTDKLHTTSFEYLVAADGVNSPVRHALLKSIHANASNDVLSHGYKELTVAADAQGVQQLERNALNIWPRGGFMLIALPNLDGSFTVTLFLPLESSPDSPESFASLHDEGSIKRFFARYFPDALALMPKLAEEFMSHPVGRMNTIRSSRWTDASSTVLIGDAAHAIVPFHGQGMNCAFEDCIELDALLQQHPFGIACEKFERNRKPNTNAIADMALENYIEMRDTLRHPKFLLQKELSFALEQRFPDRFIPRYSMVMFHHDIPYAIAHARGRIQTQILDELTHAADRLDEIDLQKADELIQTRLAVMA